MLQQSSAKAHRFRSESKDQTRRRDPWNVGYPGICQSWGSQLRAFVSKYWHVEHRSHYLYLVRDFWLLKVEIKWTISHSFLKTFWSISFSWWLPARNLCQHHCLWLWVWWRVLLTNFRTCQRFYKKTVCQGTKVSPLKIF